MLIQNPIMDSEERMIATKKKEEKALKSEL